MASTLLRASIDLMTFGELASTVSADGVACTGGPSNFWRLRAGFNLDASDGERVIVTVAGVPAAFDLGAHGHGGLPRLGGALTLASGTRAGPQSIN